MAYGVQPGRRRLARSIGSRPGGIGKSAGLSTGRVLAGAVGVTPTTVGATRAAEGLDWGVGPGVSATGFAVGGMVGAPTAAVADGDGPVQATVPTASPTASPTARKTIRHRPTNALRLVRTLSSPRPVRPAVACFVFRVLRSWFCKLDSAAE